MPITGYLLNYKNSLYFSHISFQKNEVDKTKLSYEDILDRTVTGSKGCTGGVGILFYI